MKKEKLTIEEKYGSGSFGVDPEADRAEMYADLLRLETLNEQLLEACKLAFERLRPGSIRKDFEGHVAYAALSKAIHNAESKA